VLLFCGSKKSLVSGVPMAGALFAPAQVGLVVLPLMVFHQLQLFLCATLAARLARDAEPGPQEGLTPPALPPPPRRSRLPPPPAAAAAGFVIPDACLPGVADNLALLTRHAGVLRS
jgi:solute carrier family 10 (sodium/bile acid cotransporter), member 7